MASSEHSKAAKTCERPASRAWGCAYERCLRAARVVVMNAEGQQWGACERHVTQVRKALRDA